MYISRNICAVTVTYGSRWDLLSRTLRTLVSSGIGRIIVVNNGSSVDIRRLCAEEYSSVIDVIDLSRNFGSAKGFSIGIESALLFRPDYLLLMDDDNCLMPESLDHLLDALDGLTSFLPKELVAVAGHRPSHNSGQMAGPNARHPSSFLGFHLALKFRKIANYLLQRKKASFDEPLSRLSTAPYGGLFFARELVENIGLPNPEFVLYGDDTEYTYRITKLGGEIHLVNKAVIADSENSWITPSIKTSSFRILLEGGSDFRAYYSTRNQIFLEHHVVGEIGFVRNLNKALYLAVLALYAFFLCKKNRYKILLEAIHDGETGRLGENSKFPLPR